MPFFVFWVGMKMARTFLGLDASTQSLTAVLIDYAARKVVYRRALNFDADLPHYGTVHGVLRAEDPAVVHAPPRMWMDALDRLFEAMRRDGVGMGEIAALSGSGQQHGSVYFDDRLAGVLRGLDPGKDLAVQVGPCLSRATSPTWMDVSTAKECEEIGQALGGSAATARLTGSSPFERFTGPQIRKFAKREPQAYERTAHIALVSSMMCSLLAGKIAPIDHGDGAGMTLMHIRNKQWHPAALQATAPALRGRLPPLVTPWTVVGTVARYFVRRYGFRPDGDVVVWSGDNPNSAVGVGLVRPGMVAISLGTSDTYFGTMERCRTGPLGEGHVFGSPTGDYMALICLRNGSLARERIRDAYGLDWEGFSAALRATPPGNEGKLMLPYFEPEIVPRVLRPGVRRLGLDEGDVAGNCRAVVESQMLSMRIHSAWMKVAAERIHATGGASANREILQVMADVHGCPVHRSDIGDSAALGAALRAAHGHLSRRGNAPPWNILVDGFSDPDPDFAVHPDPRTAGVYGTRVHAYRAFERTQVG